MPRADCDSWDIRELWGAVVGVHCASLAQVSALTPAVPEPCPQAVHLGARVAAHAGAGEVVVSSTVKDLVAGSGLGFHDRGLQRLKGFSDEWRLFALDPSTLQTGR